MIQDNFTYDIDNYIKPIKDMDKPSISSFYSNENKPSESKELYNEIRKEMLLQDYINNGYITLLQFKNLDRNMLFDQIIESNNKLISYFEENSMISNRGKVVIDNRYFAEKDLNILLKDFFYFKALLKKFKSLNSDSRKLPSKLIIDIMETYDENYKKLKYIKSGRFE